MWFLPFSVCKMRAQPQVFIPTLPLHQRTSWKLQWWCQFREQYPLFHIHSDLSILQLWSFYWPKQIKKKKNIYSAQRTSFSQAFVLNLQLLLCKKIFFFLFPSLFRDNSQLWINKKDNLQSPVWTVHSECNYLKCHNFIPLLIVVILQDFSLFSQKEFPCSFL